MNRKKALLNMIFFGSGLALSFTGYRFYRILKIPDLAYLELNKELIADLAELIIPRTNTPGAKDVKAEIIIIHLLNVSGDIRVQNRFIDGLSDFKSFINSEFKMKFSELPANKKEFALKLFSSSRIKWAGLSAKIKYKIFGASFFDILKQYSTIAYCTSQLGATKGLAYDPLPGKYFGCVLLEPEQRSWATK